MNKRGGRGAQLARRRVPRNVLAPKRGPISRATKVEPDGELPSRRDARARGPAVCRHLHR
eukprot:3254806-Pleurochrysis_carterae.AAC.1